jgi:hypothetical protein
MGLILIILDVLTANSRALGDVEPPIRGTQKLRPEPEWNPNATSTRNQAALRLIIWPAYAAISGGMFLRVIPYLPRLNLVQPSEPYCGICTRTPNQSRIQDPALVLVCCIRIDTPFSPRELIHPFTL